MIYDGVVKHVYHAKLKGKVVEEDEGSEDEDFMDSLEVGRDKNGNPNYGTLATSFLEI